MMNLTVEYEDLDLDEAPTVDDVADLLEQTAQAVRENDACRGCVQGGQFIVRTQ